VDLDNLAQKLDGFLYRRVMGKMTVAEIDASKVWCFRMIRRNNPTFTEEQIQQYYDNLIHIRSYAVDNEGRRI
jgi:hypothetical protein